MPRDTSWHLEFLNRVASGQSFNEAAPEVGTTGRTLYNHFEAFPKFRAAALSARRTSGRPMAGPAPDDSPMPRIIALISAGLTVGQTAQVLGIRQGTLRNWVVRSPVREQIDAGRSRSKYGPRRWPVNIDDLLELLRNIASGLNLADACAAARIPLPTMKRWRRSYGDVDAVIVAAALDGRRRQIKPYPLWSCPGPRCGTRTGYDYGCALEPCRTAAAEQEYRRRHPDSTRRPDMPDSTTLGYEPEPTDVAAEIENAIGDITDPEERYHRATAAQVHHEAVSTALADERARICAEWWDGGNGLTYAKIGELIGASRSRAQQLVERGRTLPGR